MADFFEQSIHTYSGLSTETKPTIAALNNVPNGSRWREVDTEKTYFFNESDDAWYQMPPRIDKVTHALTTIGYEHHEQHAGSHYFIKTFLVDAGGDGNQTFFAFTTPNTTKRIHAKALLAPDVDFEINIYEGSVITGGTPIPGRNNDRDIGNNADLVAVANPTHTTPGTVIWAARNGGGRNAVGVAPGLNYEIIAKTNTVYVFELIKHIATDGIVDIDFFWYEHTPKA